MLNQSQSFVLSSLDRSRLVLLAILALASGPGAGNPQQHGAAEDGRQIATAWCISCHLIDDHQPNAATTGVPTFQGIAHQNGINKEEIVVFLQTQHVRMPDLHLTLSETSDLAEYILSLRAPVQ